MRITTPQPARRIVQRGDIIESASAGLVSVVAVHWSGAAYRVPGSFDARASDVSFFRDWTLTVEGR